MHEYFFLPLGLLEIEIRLDRVLFHEIAIINKRRKRMVYKSKCGAPFVIAQFSAEPHLRVSHLWEDKQGFDGGKKSMRPYEFDQCAAALKTNIYLV